MADLLQKNEQGQIIQAPKATPTPAASAAAAKGLGAPSTPLGAAQSGVNSDSAKMMGTPAQTQNAARVNQQANTQTLDKAERLEQAAGATNAQQEAKDKVDRLQTLGSTKTAVESLIQKQIQATTQTSTPNPQIAQESLAGITDPVKRQQATDALGAYTQNPTEENLKAVYDVVGRAGVTTGLSQYLDTAANTIAESAAAPMAVTVGTLDLSSTGVDSAQLAQTLGVTPEQLAGMSLEELNQKIDSTQAQSLMTTQQLQARLADPAISPQERSQVLAQLKQQGAAGITGVEAEVDNLQSEIDSARMVDVMGGQYTVEELLGDDGISSLIAGAVNDPKKLAEMLRDPKLAGLGSWVQSHKAALSALSQSYDAQAADFVGTQDTLSSIGRSLGEGDSSKGILETILGRAIPTSALSGDVAAIQQQLQSSGLYQALKTDPKLVAELGNDKDTLAALAASGFTADQVKNAVKLRDELQADPTALKLLGVDGKIPTSADALTKMQDALDRYEALDPRLVAKAGPYIDSEGLDIDDLETIANSSDPNGVIEDLDNWKQVQSAFSNAIKGTNPDVAAKKALFGSSDFTARDLEYAMRAGSPEAKQQILSIFDANKDGRISDEEMVGADALKRVQSALGVGGTAADIIGKSGQYNGANVTQLLASIGVDKGSFEKGVTSAVSNKIVQQTGVLAQQYESQTAAYQTAVNQAELAKQKILNDPNVSRMSKELSDIVAQAPGVMGTEVDLSSSAGIKKAIESKKKFNEGIASFYGRASGSDPIIDKLEKLLGAIAAPEKAYLGAQAAAQNAKAVADQSKSAMNKLRDLGYNVGNLDENQLYELATSMGVV